ncbi:MAG: molybdopterin-dependent oxidoreductase, partial [Cocleimonas sp.]
FERISWDEAIELCYEGIQKGIDEHGTESVMPLNYAGPHGQLAENSMDMRFFYKLGATQLNRSPLCAGVRSLSYESLFGNTLGMPTEQAEYSDLIILWGVNITTSYLHLMKIINKARKKGAKVIVIDPKRIKVAGIADLYLQVKPASDVYFALAMTAELERLGMINHQKIADKVSGLDAYLANAKTYDKDKVSEICGINKTQFDKFTKLFKNAKRVSMMIGVGVERSRNGGSSIRSAMALQVLTGQFGKLGQGLMGYYGPSFHKTPDKLMRPDLLDKPTRTFNLIDSAEHILDRGSSNNAMPIKTVFIYNHNPVIVHQNQNKMIQALSHEDVFVIGCDINMTDSMKYADVILPACSHFEHSDVYAAYGHTYLQRTEPVIDPVGESLPNMEIFRRLAKRFGFTEQAFKDTDEQLQEQAFDLSATKHKENKISEIGTDSSLSMLDLDHVWLSDKTDKITLVNQELEEQYGYGLPRYESIQQDHPFVLVTSAHFHRSNSTFGGSRVELEEVDINPKDAKKHSIENGQEVKLSNKLGEVFLKARVTDDVASGVLYSHKGAWCASSATGQTVSALLDNRKTDIGNGAAFYDAFVTISKV